MSICPTCQSSIPDEAIFCGNCGRRLEREHSGDPEASLVYSGHPGTAKGGIDIAFQTYADRPWQAETGEVRRVTYTRRFFGDVLLEAVLVVVTLVIGWFIWLFFTAKTSQTPAKRLLNVYILDTTTGQPVSAGRVWVREFLVKTLLLNILSNLTLGIAVLVNYGWVLFDSDRQALHDKIMSTIVVYAPNGLPASLAPAQAYTSTSPSAAEAKGVGEELRELVRLRDEGILTEEEYETKRKQLVDTL